MKRQHARALTHREQEVISLISSGLTNEEIARQLDLSLDGVKYHVSEILKRLGAENRRDAVALHQTRDQETSERKSRLTRGLTPREQEVISLLSSGLSNEEIARQLELSLDGVKYHVSEILRRLGAENRHDAVALHLSAGRSGRLAVLAPVMLWRKLPLAWLPKAAAGAVLTATAAGVALLAWGVMSTSSSTVTTTGRSVEQSDAANAAPRAPGVAPAAPAGAGAISAISAGWRESCAVKDGAAWCWGGLSTPRGLVPMVVPGLGSGVSAISVGMGFDSCALKDGGVWCLDNRGDSLVLVPLSGLTSGVTAISGTCALKEGGVSCWNEGGTVARAVSGLGSGVSAISAGGDHSCALKDGGAWCWGSNFAGQLGNNGTDSPVPVPVSGLEAGVSAISVGGGYSCALKEGGAWCWGDDSAGQLGNNNRTDGCGLNSFSCGRVPVPVSGLATGVSAISASPQSNNVCAVKDGGAWCWGSPYDETGHATGSHVPVAVAGLGSGVSAISAGQNHSCALKDGAVWCWGGNEFGQLGNPRPGWSDVPVAVSGLASGVSAIEGTCALKKGGVSCWGANDVGQLGNNGTSDSPVPVAVSGLASGVSAISEGPCAQKDDGLWCWGLNYEGGAVAAHHSLVPVKASEVVGGVGPISYPCALKDGGVWCVAGNPGDVAYEVPGFESGVSAISSTGALCALKDGGVWCAPPDGGPDSYANVRLAPVSGLERGVRAISGSCALQDGGVRCWGWDQKNGSTTQPVLVSALESGVSAISSGYFRVCGLKDGGVWCWRGGSVTDALPGLESGVDTISENCALKKGGVSCWGSNSNGQLGDNSPAGSYSLVPVAVQFPR